MYKYSIIFSTFGTNSNFGSDVYSSKNNLSTGMSDEIKKLVSSREGIDLKKISKIQSVKRIA